MPAQDHFVLFTLLIVSKTFVHLPDPDVGISIIVCNSDISYLPES